MSGEAERLQLHQAALEQQTPERASANGSDGQSLDLLECGSLISDILLATSQSLLRSRTLACSLHQMQLLL